MEHSNRFKHLRLRDGMVQYHRNGIVIASTSANGREVLNFIRKHRRDARNNNRDTLADRGNDHFLNLLTERRMSATREDKKPVTSERHVGVEIEFVSELSSTQIRKKFASAGLHKHVTYHSDGSVSGNSDGEVDCDGSCRDDCDCTYCNGGCTDSCDCELLDGAHCNTNHCPGDHDCNCECTCESSSNEGHEICVIAPASEIESIVKRVCEVLNSDCDASVNKTCGLHVHLDMRRMNKARLQGAYSRLTKNQPLLEALVPKSRLSNKYCERNTTHDLDDALSNNSGRYWIINFQALKEHKTLEVRLHSGTTDAVKIISWIRLLRTLAYSRTVKDTVKSFGELLHHGLPMETVFYLNSRFQEFGAKRDGWKPVDHTSELNMTEQTMNEAA